MFWVFLIAVGNFALGYAAAVHLGWASWPTFAQKETTASDSNPSA